MLDHLSLRFLVIDDSPEDAELLTEALTRVANGAHVASAASAEEGLVLARTGVFDMLLLDLPTPDTLRVLTGLHEVARYRLTPMVVVTGRFLESDVRALYETQVSAVLSKVQSFSQLQALASGLVRFWEKQVVPVVPRAAERQ